MTKENTHIMDFITEKLGKEEVSRSSMVNISNSFHDKYQVDIWSQEWKSGAHVPSNRIKHSFFLKYDKETDTVEDLTPKPKAKKNIFAD